MSSEQQEEIGIHERLARLEGRASTQRHKRPTKDYAALASSASGVDALLALEREIRAVQNGLVQEAMDLMATAQDILAQQQALDDVLTTLDAQVDQELATTISAADAQTISDNVVAETAKAQSISDKLPPITSPGARGRSSPTRR